MSLQIGAGWSKTTKDGGTYISYTVDDEALELIPQLKNMNVLSFHVPQSERKNENSPGWRLVLIKKQPQQPQEEEIPM